MSNTNRLDPFYKQLDSLQKNQTDAMHYLGKDYNKEQLIKLSIDIHKLYRNSETENQKLKKEIDEFKFINILKSIEYSQEQLQRLEQIEKIKILENQIDEYKVKNYKLININQKLFEKIQEKNDIEIYLRQMLEVQNNEMQIILFNNQIKFVYDNSLKIDEDCLSFEQIIQNRSLYMDDILTPIQQQKKTPQGKRQNQGYQSLDEKNNQNFYQFKEKIQNINIKRYQIIRDMENILNKFEQIKYLNVMRQNQGNQQIDQKAYQNILNEIKGLNQIIEEMEKNLEKFVIELNLKQRNQNYEENKIIIDLIEKLQRNIECFSYVKNVLNEVVKMFAQIYDTNLKYKIENEKLYKQLEKLEKENMEVKDKFSFQINQLNEQNQYEQQLASDIKINSEQQDCLEISNKYTNLYNQFYNDIIPELNKILQITFNLYQEESKQSPSNSELLHNIYSHIYYNDNSIVQFFKGMNLIKEIFCIPLNKPIFDKYINKNLSNVKEIWNKISNFKQRFDSLSQNIQKEGKKGKNEIIK